MSNVPEYCQVMRVKGSNGEIKELVFPKALDLNRPKRPRTTFTTEQLRRLEAEFKLNPYLVGDERTKLATALSLTDTQVKVWFQNRRTKYRKKSNTGSPDSFSSSPLSPSESTSTSPLQHPVPLPATLHSPWTHEYSSAFQHFHPFPAPNYDILQTSPSLPHHY
uniref:Homeobox domain-containing protein n=1 Tax=Steinernema glaseri TaxID=37863 RepID=A0A1I7ZNQ0_9BILA